MAFGPLRTELTPPTSRRLDNRDMLIVNMKFAGVSGMSQGDRESTHRAGGLVVTDQQPGVILSDAGNQSVIFEVPRKRLESVLGSAQLYSALAMDVEQASTGLVTTFFKELIRTHESLTPETAARMTSIGIDLIVASVAERLARETPHSVHSSVIVQRAKAYVETHYGDTALDPSSLAAAVGVSLRRLQELFHERGQHVADWIWQRRLEHAARRLADPGSASQAIGTIAYSCGFINQAHFSRRFRDRFGMKPSEYTAYYRSRQFR